MTESEITALRARCARLQMERDVLLACATLDPVHQAELDRISNMTDAEALAALPKGWGEDGAL